MRTEEAAKNWHCKKRKKRVRCSLASKIYKSQAEGALISPQADQVSIAQSQLEKQKL